MKTIKSISKLKKSRVIIRVDYNVPMKGNSIEDARRIEASFETIDFVLKKGGTPILIAHMGDTKRSLAPIAKYMEKKYKVIFIKKDIQKENIIESLEKVSLGSVVLLENIRKYDGEENNDVNFAKLLASFGEYYVNDAFSVSHRPHASIIGIPKYLPSFAGIQMMREVDILSKVLVNKSHPFLFILGGAKFGTKIPLLKRFANLADKIVISGAILNNFYKVSGFEVGKSVVEDGYDKEIKKLLNNPKLLLPVDVVAKRGNKSMTILPTETKKADMIVDIGSQSIALITEKIIKSKIIVWNGPTGFYEKGFTKGTTDLAKAIVENNKKAIIGGGDTGAVIESITHGMDSVSKKNIFISTGGGATLEYLASGTLVGIKALK
jgi:phosphoglycerate kinase